MFLTTDASRKWRFRFFVVFLLVVASYIKYRWDQPYPHGGTGWGLVYGWSAAGIVLLLVLLAVRKRSYRSSLGTMEGWTQVHVYLGLLVVVIALFHSGFRFEDTLATWTLIAMALVSFTGFIGSVLYTVIPRALTEVGTEPDQFEISRQLNLLSKAMAQTASGSNQLGAVQKYLSNLHEPYAFGGWRFLFRDDVEPRKPGADFQELLANVPPAEQDLLKRILVQSRQHSKLHQRLISQQRYRNLLRVWLYLHVPLTLALLVLIAAHATYASYFT